MTVTSSGSSLAYAKVRGRRIPLVTIPNCHTCTHTRRRMIERLLIDGESPPRIAKRMARLDGPSEASIRRHYQRGHMPMDARSVVERQEEQAQRHAAHVEGVTDLYAVEYAKAQRMVNRSYRTLTTGVPMADALQACRFMFKVEALAKQQALAERAEREGTASLLRAIAGLLDITHTVVGDDAWVEIVERARNDHPDFQKWSRHSALAETMAEHQKVDEGRTHAYRNTLRKRWAKVPRKNYFTGQPHQRPMGLRQEVS